MSRLTHRCGKYINYKQMDVDAVIQKLADYEDIEEQGLLLRLPCKAGSKVYEIIDDCNFGGDCHTKRMCNGCEDRDLHIEPLYLTTELSIVSRMTDFGKTIFLTCSEAEEALAAQLTLAKMEE